MTLAGTLATADDVVLSDTTAPPTGAAPVSVTVPWESMPPSTLFGLIENELNDGGFTVIEAVLVDPL